MGNSGENVAKEKPVRQAVVYRDPIDGWIAESVVTLDKDGSLATSFLTNKGGVIDSMNHIPEPIVLGRTRYTILPASIYSYPYRPYKVPPDASLKPPTLQEAWDKTYERVDKTIDHERIYKVIITGAIIETYLIDWFYTTPYYYFVGDTESGKTHALTLVKELAYRPLYGADIPAADLIRFLPVDDSLSYTIIEDEFHGVEKSEVKLKVWKAGYKRGVSVPRVKQNTDIVEYFNPFGVKFAAGERLPRDKGLNERFIVIQMVEGDPEIDDWNSVDLPKFVDDLRLKLLLLRLDLLSKPRPKLEVSWLRKRPRELYYPLLLVAYGTSYYDELENFVREIIEERRRQRAGTFEAFLTEIVLDSLIKRKQSHQLDGLCLSIDEDIWAVIKERLDVVDNPSKPWVLETDEFGTISKQKVGRRLREILNSRIEVKKVEGRSKRFHVFDEWRLQKAARKYGLDEKLRAFYVSTFSTDREKTIGSEKPSQEPPEAEKTGASKTHISEKNVESVESVTYKNVSSVGIDIKAEAKPTRTRVVFLCEDCFLAAKREGRIIEIRGRPAGLEVCENCHRSLATYVVLLKDVEGGET